jgi:hypothetical protein
MMVYRRDTHVFRACIPICSNGVQSLATLMNEDIVLGGGDGSVTILSGHDMSWHKIKTVIIYIIFSNLPHLSNFLLKYLIYLFN